ncbi:hypothetical protein CPAR01_15042 [Colletotrichum paranaense]|uniref:Uncharacterized protein n=1 Tax=Colletotrichum paranaense TaxID=1914294 RepID=A0ABQ9S1L4_9PEZI|nr:uncharacterized protein CPAR01_15042 [Colletotrichum paranaense]KAK1521519.1 hypothetical protein CPAR01_15042 [Colletotrichum paranaense]
MSCSIPETRVPVARRLLPSNPGPAKLLRSKAEFCVASPLLLPSPTCLLEGRRAESQMLRWLAHFVQVVGCGSGCQERCKISRYMAYTLSDSLDAFTPGNASRQPDTTADQPPLGFRRWWCAWMCVVVAALLLPRLLRAG